MKVQLCELCQCCLEGRAEVRRCSSHSATYVHHKTAKGPQHSAAAGCRFCERILRYNERRFREASEVDLEFRVDIERESPRISLHSKIKQAEDGVVVSTCTPTTILSMRLRDIAPVEDTTSEQSLAFIRDQLATCLECHTSQCTTFEKWWPTRLLDVSTDLDSLFRLVESKDANPVSPYITLSHCWGLSQPMKLSEESELQLKQGYSVDSLPKTFQDTVAVCRYLDVKYLWIDSLCIVQDQGDKSDWLRESVLMDKVYAHSLCTLAATASTDGNGGLFKNRKPVETIEVACHEHGKLASGTYAVLNPKADGPSFDYTAKIKDGPLNKRAWVYQERMLSNRVVHFTEDEILWECGDGLASELLPDGIPQDLNRDQIGWKNEATPKKLLALARSGDPNVDMKGAWDIVHKAFANTRLTVVTDRVVALAGLAKLFQSFLQDTYWVGMWKKTIHHDLVWEVPIRKWRRVWLENDESKLSQYRAPSWSWLSVEGTTYLSQSLQDQGGAVAFEYVYQVVDVQIKHPTDDVTGPVQHGALYLRGTIIPVILEGLATHIDDCHPYWNFKMADLEDHYSPTLSLPDYGKSSVPTQSTADEHYCMPLVIRHNRMAICMLLEAIEDSPNTFRRIGLGEISAKRSEADGMSRFVERLKEMQTQWQVPAVAFDEASGLCTICVV